MRPPLPLSCRLAALAVAACPALAAAQVAKAPPPGVTGAAVAPPPATPLAVSPGPGAPLSGVTAAAEAGGAVTLRCSDGSLMILRRAGKATLRITRFTPAEQTVTLSAATGAKGESYVGGGWQWTGKGQGGRLSRLRPGEKLASDPGLQCFPAPEV